MPCACRAYVCTGERHSSLEAWSLQLQQVARFRLGPRVEIAEALPLYEAMLELMSLACMHAQPTMFFFASQSPVSRDEQLTGALCMHTEHAAAASSCRAAGQPDPQHPE